MHSLLAALLAAALMITGWYGGTEAMHLIGRLRGLSDLVLQGMFREFVIPGVAAYIGSYCASRWVAKSNPWNAFCVLSFALVGFLAYFASTALTSRHVETALATGFVFITILSYIIGAYMFARRHSSYH
jgi:hypothetical protein